MVEIDIPLEDIKDYLEDAEDIVHRIYEGRRTQIAETFIEFCTPYVPIKTGQLRESAEVIDNGYAVRWSAESSKGYDYAPIQYDVPFNHPRGGTDNWDYHMLADIGDKFMDAVQEILKK